MRHASNQRRLGGAVVGTMLVAGGCGLVGVQCGKRCAPRRPRLGRVQETPLRRHTPATPVQPTVVGRIDGCGAARRGSDAANEQQGNRHHRRL